MASRKTILYHLNVIDEKTDDSVELTEYDC